MAIIIDPDLIRRSTQASTGIPDGEVYIDTLNKTIELISTADGFAGGNLIASDGVSLQALYSFLKERWKAEADLIKFDFPMEAITSEQFEFVNDWTPSDTNTPTRTYIRNGGWAERDSSNVINREYMGVITLGNIENNHKAYYAWDGDTSKTDFTYFGTVNEAVQIYGDGTNGAFDNRTTVLNVFIRSNPEGTPGNVTGFTFDKSTTTDIGAPTVTNQVYRFPLSENVDINITKLDNEVDGTAPYDDMSIEYFSTPQSLDVGGINYDFQVIIDGNVSNVGLDPSTSEIYEFVQRELRKDADIDTGAGTVNGFLADPLVVFVGDNLNTLRQSDDTGVYITDFNLDFINTVTFVDNTGTSRTFPFSATVSLALSSTLIEDPNTKFWLFYTAVPNGNYGTADAVLVEDDSDIAVSNDLHYLTYTPTTGSASGTTNGSATSGGTVMTVSGESWTADDLIGQVLTVTTGDNAKNYFITTNDATTITVDGVFEVTDASMSWEIRQKNTSGVYQFIFDYENEIDGGRTPNTDAPVTLVALGLENAQFVSTTGTITKTATVNIPITAALERNYTDPV